MKNLKYIVCLFVLVIATNSCNKIPNKPVFEELSTKELANAAKINEAFYEFYDVFEAYRSEMKEMSAVKKATYNSITYRRLFDYYLYIEDSIKMNPRLEVSYEKLFELEKEILTKKDKSCYEFLRDINYSRLLSTYK